MFRFVNLFILLYQLRNRVLDRMQIRTKNQESDREEIGLISYQTAIMIMESIRAPHLNHVLLVVEILLQLPTMPSLLRVLPTTPLIDNLLLPLNLDEGILLTLLRLEQQIPMLLLPRTGLRRKVLDDLALELDLPPNPNPPNQHLLIIHPEKTKAEPFLLTMKEMI